MTVYEKIVLKECFSRQKLGLPCKLNTALLAARTTGIAGKATHYLKRTGYTSTICWGNDAKPRT